MRGSIEEIEAYSRFVDQAAQRWEESLQSKPPGSKPAFSFWKDGSSILDWPGQE